MVGQLPEEEDSIRQRRTKYNLGYGAQNSIARSKKVTGSEARLSLPAIEYGGVDLLYPERQLGYR